MSHNLIEGKQFEFEDGVLEITHAPKIFLDAFYKLRVEGFLKAIDACLLGGWCSVPPAPNDQDYTVDVLEFLPQDCDGYEFMLCLLIPKDGIDRAAKIYIEGSCNEKAAMRYGPIFANDMTTEELQEAIDALVGAL